MQIVYMTSGFKATLYRDVLALVLGLLLVIWPDVALKYIIMVIGAMFLLIGLIAFFVSRKNHEDRRRSLVPFSGIGSMAFGLLLLSFPSFFTTIFMFILGVLLLFAAVGQLITLATIRRFGTVSSWSYLYAVLILIAGIVVLFNPFTSAETVLMLFGCTAIFYGVTDLFNQYNVRKIRKIKEEQENIHHLGQLEEVEDADYEEVK
jgi:uncharacterized membrane protein HdeD (DUF308 family)